MDLKFIQEIPEHTLNFTSSLREGKSYKFTPMKKGLTSYGKKLELGFSCYALKIFYMLNGLSLLDHNEIDNWGKYINSFQNNQYKGYSNYYIDSHYLKYYQKIFSKESLNSSIKSIINNIGNKDYDTKKVKLFKGINAETKQAISTLAEIGKKSELGVEVRFSQKENLIEFLNSLDWSKPWSAGGQFASFCVYNETQNLNFKNTLMSYANNLVDNETGSYFTSKPKNSREIINGAMKIISGLDWLNVDIHYPKQLIDFCLKNKPIIEGCDIVDYIYVLYKCSKQSNYKTKEINILFESLLKEIMKLYLKNEGGFSYFTNKSQTHYYGVKISKGKYTADLHGTLLCTWGIIMILDSFENKNEKYSIIKP